MPTKSQSVYPGSYPDKPTKMQIAAWIAVLIVAALLFARVHGTFQLGTYGDDASYVVLAQSLVFSSQYGLINSPDRPAVSQYPFGYPLLLASFILLFPDQPSAMVLLSVAATLLNASLLFWGWRWLTRHKSYWWGIAVASLYVLSPLTVNHTRMVMSEPVFMTFSLLVLLLSEQAARGAQTRWWGPAMSVAMVGAVFTRTIGVVLLAVIFVYLMVVRGKGFWRHIALVASQMGLLVGLIVVATSVRPQDLVPSAYMRDDAAAFLRSPYVEGVALQLTEEGTPSRETNAGAVSTDWKQRIKTCLVDNLIVGGIVQHLGGGVRCIAVPLGCGEREQDLANRIGIPTLPLIIGLLVSGLVLLGLARSLAQTGSSAFVVSGFVYLGSLFLWLWDDVRLLYLIQPQIHFGLLLGLEAIPMWIAPLSRKESLPNMRGVLLGILVLALIMASIVKAQRLDDTRLHTADLEARARWLMQYTSDSDIVMSEEPQTDFVYTGRKTVPYPTSQTSTELEVYLRTYKVSRVFIAPAVQWQSRYTPVHSQDAVRILPLLQALVSQGHMKHVYSSETNLIQVYQTQFQD